MPQNHPQGLDNEDVGIQLPEHLENASFINTVYLIGSEPG